MFVTTTSVGIFAIILCSSVVLYSYKNMFDDELMIKVPSVILFFLGLLANALLLIMLIVTIF